MSERIHIRQQETQHGTQDVPDNNIGRNSSIGTLRTDLSYDRHITFVRVPAAHAS